MSKAGWYNAREIYREINCRCNCSMLYINPETNYQFSSEKLKVTYLRDNPGRSNYPLIFHLALQLASNCSVYLTDTQYKHLIWHEGECLPR